MCSKGKDVFGAHEVALAKEIQSFYQRLGTAPLLRTAEATLENFANPASPRRKCLTIRFLFA
jgi:hypothetical protein